MKIIVNFKYIYAYLIGTHFIIFEKTKEIE